MAEMASIRAMNATTPRPRAYVLGAEMRDARRKSGLTLRGLASILDVSHSVLVRWERGDRVPAPESVSAVCAVLGVSATTRNRLLKLTREAAAEPARTPSPGGAPEIDQLSALLEFERTAASITNVAPTVVPPLLQTADYARAIMDAGEPEGADKRVAMRLGRREVVTRRRSAVGYTALVLESALHLPVGGRGVLLDQLAFLLEIGRHEKVDIRVVPLSAGWTPAQSGPFVLLEFAKAPPVVHLEHHRTAQFVQEADDVAGYVEARDQVIRAALTSDDSATFIKQLIAHEEAA